MTTEGKKISELEKITTTTGDELVLLTYNNDNKVIKIKDLLNVSTEYINIIDENEKSFRIEIENNKIALNPLEIYTSTPVVEGENTLFDGLIINQVYGGGDNVDGTPISHSFIELYNFRDLEVNLNGLYLWYRAKSGSWQSLPLKGIIPAKHSFLIRCGPHSAMYSEGIRLNIENYDMSWNIKLSDKGFSTYLCIGNTTPEDNPVRQTTDATGIVNWTNGRYIDLLGAGGKNAEDTIWAYETRYLKCMDKNTAVHRIDFANAGTKNIGSNALVSKNNEADCEPINYKTCNVDIYRPRSLKDGRWTEFYDKPKQKETSPSMINVAYGENGDTTRTFTFQTPLTTDGFVKYRKEGVAKWTRVETTTQVATHVDGDTTVHRTIITDLEVGKYEYQVGTDGCSSDIYTFEVKIYDSNSTLRMLWTTDQQSWTAREYDVWNVCARFLNKKANLFDFHLNTGDISQNASRTFEWKYYYDYSKDITKNMCHMITCGNNDLLEKKYSDAFTYYITPENPFANSVHAFDLGFTHFVCLNSNDDSTYLTGTGSIGGYESTNAFLQAQATWLDTHLTEVRARATKPRWIIVYAHLSPFTVGRILRLQRWVNVIEKHKVDLFLCGHNHAYSRSKSLYTGYDYNINPAYNDYVTKVSGGTDLKIVDELNASGTEINRTEDLANGTVYILNQATGFKLSGKEKPLTLTTLAGTKHVNSDNSPWWIAKQALPSNPVYIDLQIEYNQIIMNAYQIAGIVTYDQYKNTIINNNLNSISETLLDTLTINYSDRNK